MSGQIFVRAHQVIPDASGQPYPQAVLTFYLSGINTLANIYADAGLTASLVNPVTANSAGVFPAIWLDPAIIYRYKLETAAGELIEDEDPFPIGGVLSDEEISAGLTYADIDASITELGNVYRYKAIGDGVANDSAAFARAISANGRVIVPPGIFAISNVLVSRDNVLIEGHGHTSILKVTATNSRLFNVTGQAFKLKETLWQGDGTSTSSITGVGVYLNQAGEAVFENNYSTGFGFGAISGSAATNLIGPKIINHKCRLTAAGGNEFYLGGLWVDTVIENVNAYSALADRVLLLYDNSTTGWTGLTVRGGSATGYVKQQFGTSDENWDGSVRVSTAVFDTVRCVQSTWSAIKCKTSRNVKIINCTFVSCGLQQEDASSGLYGDVLVNSLGKVEIANNTFRGSGSTAIKANAPGVFQYPGALPSGQANDIWRITGNKIDTTGVVWPQGDGISVSNGMKGLLITQNIMRGVTRYGINAIQTAASPGWDIGVFGNVITDCPDAQTGINVQFHQSLRQGGNLIQNGPATGVQISDVDHVQIESTDTVLDPAVGSGRGYQIGNVKVLNFKARAGNSAFPTWVTATAYLIGSRVFNGANVYECVVAGNSGAGPGPIHTAGASTEGSVVWVFVGKYQLMPYAIRLVGTQGKTDLDFDAHGCITGPIEGIVVGASGTTIRYKTSIATTNATPTNAQVVPIPDLSGWMCEAKVLAFSVGVNRAMYHKTGLFYRAGGSTTLQGAVTSVVSVESDAAWDCVPAASGNNLAPAQVTGAAATNINWAVDVTLIGMP